MAAARGGDWRRLAKAATAKFSSVGEVLLLGSSPAILRAGVGKGKLSPAEIPEEFKDAVFCGIIDVRLSRECKAGYASEMLALLFK